MSEDYTGARFQWEKSRDPRWVWRVIRTCIRDAEPFPEWVRDYLANVSEGIEKARGDVGRKLHSILRFPSKRGRQRSIADDMNVERYAARFMKLLLDGKSPGHARREAARLAKITADEKEQTRLLREFFDLKTLPAGPTSKQHWKMIIATWCIHHPGYHDRYPFLPMTFDFRPGGNFAK